MHVSRCFAVVALGLIACGDGGGGSTPQPDATVIPPDAAPPDGPTLPPGCDFLEANDQGNDLLDMGTAETTNLTFSQSTTVCGVINPGHFDAMNETVDSDAFALTLTAPATVLVTLAGAGAEALAGVDVLVVTEGMEGLELVASGSLFNSHAVAGATLPAGNYMLVMIAENPADAAAAINYKIRVVTDDPATRCGKLTATANYTEANDGANNTGNDMVDVRFETTPARALTADANDAPEPTAITTAAGTKYRITGTAANVNAGDEYMDRDTFLIRTGADTNQLAIRLNWPGTTVDFDYLLFPAGASEEIAGSTQIANMEDEFATFAVLPDTDYWLWIAPYDGSTMLPTTYDASVCAESFTP